MNREDDLSYFARRARQEREKAALAKDTAIESVHRMLAAAYERRVGRCA